MDIFPWNIVFCECCGQPVVTKLPPGIFCATCQQRLPAYAKARSPLRYAFPIDTALKAMKFRAQLMYAPAFASLLLPALESEFGECDALVAVPLHRWRHIRRGFNQAAELCKDLAAGTKLPVIDNAVRVRSTQTQSGLTSTMRKANMRGAFLVRGKLGARYPLIVDDVITTGTTCEHLAIALLEAGAEKVGVLTVARSATAASSP
jgi:ComF family protein